MNDAERARRGKVVEMVIGGDPAAVQTIWALVHDAVFSRSDYQFTRSRHRPRAPGPTIAPPRRVRRHAGAVGRSCRAVQGRRGAWRGPASGGR